MEEAATGGGLPQATKLGSTLLLAHGGGRVKYPPTNQQAGPNKPWWQA
jgi:hypothetical protein